MQDKDSKFRRTLDIYVRLCEGKQINKAEEAERFGVDERSIQRDIDDIRAFLSERMAENGNATQEVVYDRVKKGFVMTGEASSMMNNTEILAVSKILLASRAFTKKELSTILEKLVEGCVPQKNMKLVSDLLLNERYHYVELSHKSSIQNKLWELGEEIKEQNLIRLTYQRQINATDVVTRVVQPVALMFSEYYFYLNGYIVEKNEKGEFERKYDYPTVFRLDRIIKYRRTGDKFQTVYRNRFEEGEFRKRNQFMFAGELVKVQFKYFGNSVDSVLDRLPTARVIEEQQDYRVIEAEVFGQGILMWLLGQGNLVEVIKPESMRTAMKERLHSMLERYE